MKFYYNLEEITEKTVTELFELIDIDKEVIFESKDNNARLNDYENLFSRLEIEL